MVRRPIALLLTVCVTVLLGVLSDGAEGRTSEKRETGGSTEEAGAGTTRGQSDDTASESTDFDAERATRTVSRTAGFHRRVANSTFFLDTAPL